MRTHGETIGQIFTPEYRAWRAMKARCYNPHTRAYHNYGGRGIQVCDEWRNSYETFVRDMGRRPSSRHTLERVNNNENYSPKNCIWATYADQARNKRTNVFITINGITRCLSEWSKVSGIKRRTLEERVKNNWSPETLLGPPRFNKRWHSYDENKRQILTNLGD